MSDMLYNPIRSKEGKDEIKVISTIHMLSEEQGIDSSALYEEVGLTAQEGNIVNLTATAILESDYLTVVSKGLVHEFYKPETSFGLSDIFNRKKIILRV